jgi:hypothetical protein
MEIPEESVVPFLRRDLFTDLRIDRAMPFGDFFRNTPGSRSIASLLDWTFATHLRLRVLIFHIATQALSLIWDVFQGRSGATNPLG